MREGCLCPLQSAIRISTLLIERKVEEDRSSHLTFHDKRLTVYCKRILDDLSRKIDQSLTVSCPEHLIWKIWIIHTIIHSTTWSRVSRPIGVTDTTFDRSSSISVILSVADYCSNIPTLFITSGSTETKSIEFDSAVQESISLKSIAAVETTQCPVA